VDKGHPVTSPPLVIRGYGELRRLLREQTFDLRRLDLPGFRRWLDGLLARWQNDPVFVQRAKVRDLRRTHPSLRTLEDEYRRAALADAASVSFPRLHRLEQELASIAKAVRGLTEALRGAPPERQPAVRQKLETFLARRQALEDETADLIRATPERQELLRIGADLERLRSAVGLDREEAAVARLLKQQGRRSGRSGDSFEELALALTWSAVVPDLVAGDEASPGVHVLPGVTLGAARTEFDQLVVRQPADRAQPVEVLAVVEAKRNINDLAHGFRLRQENLAWLTGATDGYDAELYRTGHFRSGHFDREAVHRHGGESFVFVRDSLRHFRREPRTGFILDRLYFITREGPLWGLSAAALRQVSAHVATDRHWAPDSDVYLEGLRRWCLARTEPLETPDVLEIYASTPGHGDQVLFATR
jgi:hypothetical protein